jgi:hypothetical protein
MLTHLGCTHADQPRSTVSCRWRVMMNMTRMTMEELVSGKGKARTGQSELLLATR